MTSTAVSRSPERVLQSSLEQDGSFTLVCSDWPGLRLNRLRAALQIDGHPLNLVASTTGVRGIYAANEHVLTLG
ncbi:MAG: hypothetical protein ACYCYF_12925, partial [Anaerolineae bacterium]